MELDYQRALRLEGKMITFKNNLGEWSIGRVSKVRKDGLETEELSTSSSDEGYDFGFFGPRPFFRRRRPPVFFRSLDSDLIHSFFGNRKDV